MMATLSSSREKRLEALFGIARNLAAELEPDALLHLIVESATRLLGATSGSLVTLSPADGETLDIRVAVGLGEARWRALKLRRGEGVTGWVAETGRPLLVPDVAREPRYYTLEPSIRSELAVPLVADGRVLGVLNVDSTRENAFLDEDVELLSALAAHSTVVLRNAEMYQETRRHARALRTLLEISGSLTSSLERQEILYNVVARTTQLLRMKMCALFLVDETGTMMLPETAYGCSPRYLEMAPLPLAGTLLGAAAQQDRPVLSLNVRTDVRYQYPERAVAEGLCSLLAAPMRYQEEVLGVLVVYSAHPHVFTQSEEEILATLADLASSALANARLHGQVLEAEEQLARLEKFSALGEMAAGLAHEIRNPLAVMKMLLHGLGEDAPAGSPQAEDVQILVQKVSDIGATVNQLLQLARPVPMQREPLRLADVLERTLLLVRHRLREHHIELECELATGPEIEGDAGRLSQLVLNLVLNSCDAMPDGGTLSVRLSYEPGEAVLTISDTGPGVSDEVFAKLFAPFTTSKSTGMGLGLSIAKRIVEEHGGKMLPTSRPGQGFTMEVRLPVHHVSSLPAGGN